MIVIARFWSSASMMGRPPDSCTTLQLGVDKGEIECMY